MKLSTISFALSCAALWGGGILLVGLLNVIVPAYGGDFLRLIGSVYPGAGTGLPGVLAGTGWGILDGAVAGFLLAWLYNYFFRSAERPAGGSSK